MQLREDGLRFLTQGYAWMPDRRRALQRRTVRTRLGGMPALGLVGPDAARFFYDEAHIRRHGAIPGAVLSTLFGHHGVQTLDGPAHRRRKALFTPLMDADRIDALVAQMDTAWDRCAGRAAGQALTVFDHASRVLTRAVFDGAGVPLADDEVPTAAGDLVAMVDGLGGIASRQWRARAARARWERRLTHLIEAVRDGRAALPPGSLLDRVARHRDLDDRPLPGRVAAVELLNILRPTVAVAWYAAFAAHALQRWPRHREPLRTDDPAYVAAFVHEVRRFYPFAPFLGGLAVRDLAWHGQAIPAGTMVLLDVFGYHHDPRYWSEPYRFQPQRFVGREVGPFDLLPQGGGDPLLGHRCPGESSTVALLSWFCVRLAAMEYELPPQDLTIPLRRIPTRPRSGVVLIPSTVVRTG
jgi:fatty-acid peroxygenase